MKYLAKLFSIMVITVISGFSQGGTSAISGTITDVTGSAIPSARVTLTNEQTGVTQALLSNESGLFRAGSLVPGVYRVEVEADGFQKLVRKALTVEVGQVIALDLPLELGKASETV